MPLDRGGGCDIVKYARFLEGLGERRLWRRGGGVLSGRFLFRSPCRVAYNLTGNTAGEIARFLCRTRSRAKGKESHVLWEMRTGT